jgi:hypothetical protein
MSHELISQALNSKDKRAELIEKGRINAQTFLNH